MSNSKRGLDLKSKEDRERLEDLRVKSRGQRKVLLNMLLTD